MSMIKWRGEDYPIGGLQQELSRLFEDFAPWTRAGTRSMAGRWSPTVDVTETPETFVVETEIPGIDPKEVEVSLIGDTLTVKGEKRSKEEKKDAVRHYVERTYGAFTRSVTLPGNVDPERLTATSRDGVLTITLGKREEAKSRRISIKAQ
jgi:HSP20 family protein